MDIYKFFMALAVASGAIAWWWQQRANPPIIYLAMMCAVVVPGQIAGNLFAAMEHPGFALMDVLLGHYGANILGGVIGGVCEFLRVNPKYAGLSQAQWLSAAMVMIGISIFFTFKRRTAAESAVPSLPSSLSMSKK